MIALTSLLVGCFEQQFRVDLGGLPYMNGVTRCSCRSLMQMRFLQTLVDVGAENNTTIVFPVPIELASTFLQSGSGPNGRPRKDEPEFGPKREAIHS